MKLTLLTGLFDLGRGQIDGEFQRDLDYYTDSLSQLMQLTFPKVICLDRRISGFKEDSNTRIIPMDADALKQFPHYERVQDIRQDPTWYGRSAWLKDSPQCRLSGYVPLVMSKMIWLHDLARANPFRSDGVFWLDAGICNNDQFSHYGQESFIRNLIGVEFSHLWHRCLDESEVHGFERVAFDDYCGGRFVDKIVPGGLFGGSNDTVFQVFYDYLRIMEETLGAGYMGTEENLLTIMFNQKKLRSRWRLGVR